MKFAKIIVLAVLGIAVVVIGGIVFVSNQFDSARLKSEAIKVVQEKTGRTLTIDGDLALSFWPSLGVSVGRVSLSERLSAAPFAALDEARVAVALWPLLSRQIQVNRIHLKGVRATLIRRADGSLNIADLLVGAANEKVSGKEKTTDAAQESEALTIDIAGVSIADAAFNWIDEQHGGKASIAGLNLRTGKIMVDTAQRSYSLADLSLALKGLRDTPDGDERFEVQFELPAFSLTPASLAVGGVKLSTVQASAHRYFKSKLMLARFDDRSPGDLTFELEAFKDELKAKGKFSSQMRAERDTLMLHLDQLKGDFEVLHPSLPNKAVKLALDGVFNAGLTGPSVDGVLNAQFDDSKLTLKIDVPTFSPLAVQADLAVDQFNLDRYLPGKPVPANLPGKPAASLSNGRPAEVPRPLDLAFLNEIDLKAELRVGSLQAKKLQVSDLKMSLRAAKGRLDIAPVSAGLYDGTLAGSLGLVADGNVLLIKQQLTGVDIGALLKDGADSELLEGRARVAVDLKTQGASVNDLKDQLAGSAKLSIAKGAFRGIDLSKTANELQALLGKNATAPAAGSGEAKTEFAELNASFQIADGVAHNDDLLATSPFLRLQGSGDINLRENRLDYLLKAGTVKKATTKKRRKAVDQLKEAGIPVRLSGPLDKPQWAIDQGSVVNEAVNIGIDQLKQKAAEQVGEKLGEKLGDTLKGLFGR